MHDQSKHFLKGLSVVVVSTILLAACSETKFLMHTAKRLGNTNTSQGKYKVGKPYKVLGKWYTPAEDMRYDRVGIASWYGPNFHGKMTANGEIFDQWEVSAAHKTLPMPSIVRVTNLDNGRSLVIRINDRGPFVDDRIIDLSRRSAQLLGVEKVGTAKVRVQILAEESRIVAERAKAGGTELAQADAPIKAENVGSQPVASQPLPDPRDGKMQSKLYVEPGKTPSTASNAPVTQETILQKPVLQKAAPAVAEVPTAGLYVQAGAFSNPENAERVRQALENIGHVSITPITVSGRELYRVRIGPIADTTQADHLRTRVIAAGYDNARTVVDLPVTN